MIKNTIMKNTLKQDYRSLKKADGFYRAELKPNGYRGWQSIGNEILDQQNYKNRKIYKGKSKEYRKTKSGTP
jgi:hypothetical protein